MTTVIKRDVTQVFCKDWCNGQPIDFQPWR